MSKKWHKNCGGVVRYQRILDRSAHSSRAGFCLKCKDFPITEEDIMFELEDGLIEHCNGKEWLVSDPRNLGVVLDTEKGAVVNEEI